VEWLTGLDLTTVEAIQFAGAREWVYVKPGTLTTNEESVDFDDQFSEHWVRGRLDAVTAVRYKKPGEGE
jgi:hypothetical protein